MAASHEQNYFDLVCEGGGVKGIGLSGAYSVLEEQGYVARSCAGTSAGAITAALIAAGYDSAKLREVIFGLDYLEFEDATWEDRIPLLGRGLSIAIENGMYKGDEFEDWIRGLLADKGVHTFADLRAEPGDDDDDGDEGFKSCLQVIASDLTARQMLVLPRDAREGLGIEPEELEVAKAVRMSMSIPVFFEPVRWSNPRTKREHLIVDGGVLSNFPLWMFDRKDDKPPRWPTFGLLLVEPDPTRPIAEPVAEPEHGARGPRGADRDAQEPGGDDAPGARPHVHRQGPVRAHDPDPHLRRRHDRVRHQEEAGQDERAVRGRPHGGHPLPRHMGLPRLREGVPRPAGGSPLTAHRRPRRAGGGEPRATCSSAGVSYSSRKMSV